MIHFGLSLVPSRSLAERLWAGVNSTWGLGIQLSYGKSETDITNKSLVAALVYNRANEWREGQFTEWLASTRVLTVAQAATLYPFLRAPSLHLKTIHNSSREIKIQLEDHGVAVGFMHGQWLGTTEQREQELSQNRYGLGRPFWRCREDLWTATTQYGVGEVWVTGSILNDRFHGQGLGRQMYETMIEELLTRSEESGRPIYFAPHRCSGSIESILGGRRYEGIPEYGTTSAAAQRVWVGLRKRLVSVGSVVVLTASKPARRRRS